MRTEIKKKKKIEESFPRESMQINNDRPYDLRTTAGTRRKVRDARMGRGGGKELAKESDSFESSLFSEKWNSSRIHLDASFEFSAHLVKPAIGQPTIACLFFIS